MRNGGGFESRGGYARRTDVELAVRSAGANQANLSVLVRGGCGKDGLRVSRVTPDELERHRGSIVAAEDYDSWRRRRRDFATRL